MEQVFVDPEKLEEFAARLVAFTGEVESIQRSIRSGLQSLGATWRDEEFQKFLQGFMHVERLLLELIREVQEVHPKLRADAQYIREYLQIRPQGR